MTARIFNLDDDDRFVRAPDPIQLVQRDSGFSGAISLPLLPDLIQIYTVSMADGALTIRRGTESGTIWFERGAMVHAVCGGVTGEQAVYLLMRWDDGQFSLDKDSVAPAHSIQASWQEVLMEGCRLIDEAAADPFHDVFARLEADLSGFVAAAILDANSGALIAQRARTAHLDFAAAGPLAVEMLRQQARVMASLGRPSSLIDSLSTLDDQLHLLEALPEGHLLYLVVAREGLNLAVVRRVVDRALGRI